MPKILNYRILIWSGNPDKLAEFYSKALGLELVKKYELIDDYGYAFKINDNLLLWIGRHSGIIGKNKEPFRHIFNLYTDDVFAWYEKLKDFPEIKVIAKPFRSPISSVENPRYVFTFLDPEDNCLQFMNP